MLVIGSQYPPHILGGHELLCQSHVAWLRQRGDRVRVLTSTFGVEPRSSVEEIGAAGEAIVRALDFHWRDFQHRRPRGMSLWEGERRQRRVLERMLDEEDVDAVQVWQMAAISKSLLATIASRGLPTVAVVGEYWPIWDIDTDHWLKLWKRRPLKPLASTAAHLVAPTDIGLALGSIQPVYVSDFLRQKVEAELPAWRGRGAVARAGIELSRYPNTRNLAEPLHSPIRLLYVGRVEHRKGVHTAVEALGFLRAGAVPATLTIQGWVDAEYGAELQAMAARLSVADWITWREGRQPDTVPELMGQNDILVFPTLWDEPFGLVPLEAMAAGCVVVATGTGGSGEILIDNVSALRFEPGDSEGLAAALSRLRDDPELVLRLRTAGRATAAEHDVVRFHEALDAFSPWSSP